MEELKDLKQLYNAAEEKFSHFDGKEFVLCSLFKEEVKSIADSPITYLKYSAIIESSATKLKIFLPNQWFYIASYFTDLYNELQKYKDYALKIATKDRLKNLNRNTLSSDEEQKLEELDIDNTSKRFLKSFITDYSWWKGAKTIDRGDFYVSPILSGAKVINASQSYIAELCAFLADKKVLVDLIISSYEDYKTTSIINDDLNTIYTWDELKEIWENTYKPQQSVYDFKSLMSSFCIRFYNSLKNLEKKELGKYFGSENYKTEIGTAFHVFNIINDGKLGLSFYKKINKVLQAKPQDKKNLFYPAIRTKPFLLLAGISGTGKSQIVKEMAFSSCPNIIELRKDEVSPGNYCMIEVKPNWHDSTDLLGYESSIKNQYVITPFLQFVVKAMHYPEVPFFVCLDEMNLAPVEQYFAEFLSVLESRKVVGELEINGTKINKIKSEPLVDVSVFTKKYSDDWDIFEALGIKKVGKTNGVQEKSAVPSGTSISTDEYDRQDIVDLLKKDGLCIPQNLIVVGTVNMDETTHQFSRKVIDRAMTFEMNEADFVSYFDDNVILDYLDEPEGADLFFARNVKGIEAVKDFLDDNLKALVNNSLTELNEKLDNTPFKIAYRVQNELLIYLSELRREKEYQDTPIEELFYKAFDDIMMKKVLPRIEGDDELLGTKTKGKLHDLYVFANENKLEQSKDKIQEMLERLDSHFTSFWP